MLIFNWGKKSKKITDAGIMRCQNCHNMVGFELRELSNKAGLYFISMIKWNKKYFLACPICNAGFELTEESKNNILRETISLPDNKTSLKIWDNIVDSFNEFDGKPSELQNLLKSIEKKLIEKGYKKDDCIYVMNCFVDDLTESK